MLDSASGMNWTVAGTGARVACGGDSASAGSVKTAETPQVAVQACEGEEASSAWLFCGSAQCSWPPLAAWLMLVAGCGGDCSQASMAADANPWNGTAIASIHNSMSLITNFIRQW